MRAAFHREFIRTRLLDVQWGKLYDHLFEDRQEGDSIALVAVLLADAPEDALVAGLARGLGSGHQGSDSARVGLSLPWKPRVSVSHNSAMCVPSPRYSSCRGSSGANRVMR